MVFMESNFIVLEIFIDPKYSQRVTSPEALGLRHLTFVVGSLEEVMRIVECEEIRTDWIGRRFTFIRDSDGQPIELKEKCGYEHIRDRKRYARCGVEEQKETLRGTDI